MKKRAFIIVLDGVGIGYAPDADKYGDEGAFTLKSAYESGKLNIPNLVKMGLGNVEGLEFLGREDAPTASVGRAFERSDGKDTTTGHWEIAGIIGTEPPRTYPNGFPEDMLRAIEKAAGREMLVNKPYSGTKIIAEYGEEHIKTGKLILYTSADSVCQIAAHESVMSADELHKVCEAVREVLVGEYKVDRIIARPFAGEAQSFYRTDDRRDFALTPPYCMLDALKAGGKDVIGVGKIYDIFASKSITENFAVHGNEECCDATMKCVRELDFDGLCFVNLVDTDMEYGHRRDAEGFANALSEFDRWLGEFTENMRDSDMLVITADHGCDPGYKGTDHTRETVPVIVYGKSLRAKSLGNLSSYADIAASVCDFAGVEYHGAGESFMKDITASFELEELAKKAREAMSMSYSPYSMCTVGAALLCADGSVYTGANIESASYSPTVCAERSAFIRALNDGKRKFTAIAICGENTRIKREGDLFYPCGVCRQFMREFCGNDFIIIVTNPRGSATELHTLGEMLPYGFGPDNVI